jgi:hypothetical protein
MSQIPKVFPLPAGKRNQSLDEDNQEDTQHGEAHISASIGSNQGFKNLSTHSTRNQRFRETGYFGQASEVQWLYNVQWQMQHAENEPYTARYELSGSDQDVKRARSDGIHGNTSHAKQQRRQSSWKYATDTYFFLDRSEIPTDVFFNPYEIPDTETAEQLFDCYIKAVHSSFPLVSQIERCVCMGYTDSVL